LGRIEEDMKTYTITEDVEVTLDGRKYLLEAGDSVTIDTREELADYAHEAWAGWMKYLFSKSTKNKDGSIVIPPELVERWQRQVDTKYEELSEEEQKSDLEQADKILKIVDKA
jgi:phenylalanyl-tRNA synthetase beta subunit